MPRSYAYERHCAWHNGFGRTFGCVIRQRVGWAQRTFGCAKAACPSACGVQPGLPLRQCRRNFLAVRNSILVNPCPFWSMNSRMLNVRMFRLSVHAFYSCNLFPMRQCFLTEGKEKNNPCPFFNIRPAFAGYTAFAGRARGIRWLNGFCSTGLRYKNHFGKRI